MAVRFGTWIRCLNELIRSRPTRRFFDRSGSAHGRDCSTAYHGAEPRRAKVPQKMAGPTDESVSPAYCISMPCSRAGVALATNTQGPFAAKAAPTVRHRYSAHSKNPSANQILARSYTPTDAICGLASTRQQNRRSFLAGTQAVRHQAQNIKHQRGADQSCVTAGIEWRCNLNHIATDEV